MSQKYLLNAKFYIMKQDTHNHMKGKNKQNHKKSLCIDNIPDENSPQY